MNNSQTWFQKHSIHMVIAILVFIYIFGRTIYDISPLLGSFLNVIYYPIIFIILPFTIYKAARSKAKVTQTSTLSQQMNDITTKYEKIRNLLLIIYGIGLAVSLIIAFGSIFVFDGDDLMWARVGVFLSSIVLPITIIITMGKSKKSLYWFLLPVLPLATFLFFSHTLDVYIAESNAEFCRKAIERNDRSILDNITSSCYDQAHSQ